MPVVGVDATPPALDALAQGTLLGTVLNDATRQGQATFDLAYSLGTGKPAATDVAPLANADGAPDPKGHYIWVPYVKVTKDNYKSFIKN
jgi:methyl-galactoside transport system substrate-binding protein